MKKIVFLLLSVTFSTFTFAQGKSYKIGVKLSPAVGYLKSASSDLSTNGLSVRLGYGLMVDRMFSEKYGFGFGINMIEFAGHAEYSRLIESSDINPTIQQVKRDYDKVKYVELPVTLKLRTSEMGKFTYWGQFGLGLAYLYSALADEQTTDLYSKVDNGPFTRLQSEQVQMNNQNIRGEFNSFRASMIIALGAESVISQSTLFTYGVTYNGGLLSMYGSNEKVVKYTEGAVSFENDAKTPVFGDKKVMLNQVQLNVGIIF